MRFSWRTRSFDTIRHFLQCPFCNVAITKSVGAINPAAVRRQAEIDGVEADTKMADTERDISERISLPWPALNRRWYQDKVRHLNETKKRDGPRNSGEE